MVGMFSTGYNIPVAGSDARVKSEEVFRRLSPGYEIRIDIPPGRGKERK